MLEENHAYTVMSVRFIFNFINYFCIETLSHISMWIHFGLYDTHCVDGNHKILSWNALEKLLDIVQILNA